MLSELVFFHFFSAGEVALRLSLAGVLGFILGIDREIKHKPIGLRVMMLVSISMCCFVLIAEEVTQRYLGYEAPGFKDGLRINSLAIVGSFITGLGFLGGAAIIQTRDKIIGMTTGAGILAAGAIGAACGFALYGIAGLLTLLTFLIISIIDSLRTNYRDDVDKENGGATTVPIKENNEDK